MTHERRSSSPPSTSCPISLHRLRAPDQGGFVAGTEALAFGTLIFISGALLLLNAWALVDHRTTLDSAAREYMRAYTESRGPAEALANGRRAMAAVLDGRIPEDRIQLTEPEASRFGPCATARIEMTARVPSVRMPFVGSFGNHTVEAVHVELVNQHTEMQSGALYDPTRTACAN